MKYVNYVILTAFVGFASIFCFNHINAWLGIGIPFVFGYFVLTKVVSKIKEINLED